MSISPRIPCLVGAAQFVGREDDPRQALPPADMLAKVASAALDDCGASSPPNIDTLAVVRLFADSGGDAFSSPFGAYENLPGSVAARMKLEPGRLIYGPVGGNTPQMLTNALAQSIWKGEVETVLIAGGEALRTQARAVKAGIALNWGEPARAPAETPFPEPALLSRHEAKHGLALPVNVYPLFETAYGAAKGWNIDEHRRRIGELMAPFTEIAAANPYAQAARARTAEEIVTPTEENRWISWPYTKYLVSNMFVDQAAAAVLMSTAAADRLGIAAEKRVYLHGSADTYEKLLPVDRPDYARCPAIEVGARHALAQAGIAARDLGPIDLYSCFPIAVEMAADMIGLEVTDPARLTLTGGLAAFGGAGNAYSMHAITEMIAACRGNRQTHGLIFANGGFLTKHSFGVYSAQPDYAERIDPALYQAAIDAMPSPPLEETPSGEGTIEAYTVVFGRAGPDRAIVIGRQGKTRFLANIADELDELMTQNAVGRHISVETGTPVNRARLL